MSFYLILFYTLNNTPSNYRDSTETLIKGNKYSSETENKIEKQIEREQWIREADHGPSGCGSGSTDARVWIFFYNDTLLRLSHDQTTVLVIRPGKREDHFFSFLSFDDIIKNRQN